MEETLNLTDRLEDFRVSVPTPTQQAQSDIHQPFIPPLHFPKQTVSREKEREKKNQKVIIFSKAKSESVSRSSALHLRASGMKRQAVF